MFTVSAVQDTAPPMEAVTVSALLMELLKNVFVTVIVEVRPLVELTLNMIHEPLPVTTQLEKLHKSIVRQSAGTRRVAPRDWFVKTVQADSKTTAELKKLEKLDFTILELTSFPAYSALPKKLRKAIRVKLTCN